MQTEVSKAAKADKAQDRPSKVRTILAIAAACVLTPITLAVGNHLGDRHYYICSVLIIIYAMAPFFVSFEGRKPQARELVIIAVMCALAVASRIVFMWIPHFSPIGAIVMLSGIAFGAQAGFFTGALSMFASNFIMGQGAWTPWQMFAFGIAGLVAGLIAEYTNIPRCDYSKKQLIILAVCGALGTILIVGPILDTASLFLFPSEITKEGALAIYLSGFPVNCVQASAVFLTLLLAANPLLDKLRRVKVKYGFME